MMPRAPTLARVYSGAGSADRIGRAAHRQTEIGHLTLSVALLQGGLAVCIGSLIGCRE
jgi:hypothetical protein